MPEEIKVRSKVKVELEKDTPAMIIQRIYKVNTMEGSYQAAKCVYFDKLNYCFRDHEFNFATLKL